MFFRYSRHVMSWSAEKRLLHQFECLKKIWPKSVSYNLNTVIHRLFSDQKNFPNTKRTFFVDFSFFPTAEQRWFTENQGWSPLKQVCSALVFCVFSESALNSAEKHQLSETALFSAEYLWDFNPGVVAHFYATMNAAKEVAGKRSWRKKISGCCRTES